MLKIEKTVLPSAEQWEIMIEGMRNPKNSWHLMDSHFNVACLDEDGQHDEDVLIGVNDHKLMMGLAKGGAVHAKYRRMIPVFLTINAPLYWWKEFDAYKVGTVANSCSTMHKIHAKKFTMDDFSHEHLVNLYTPGFIEAFIEMPHEDGEIGDWYSPSYILENCIIKSLNRNRENFIKATEALKIRDLTEAEKKHVKAQQKRFWWQMVQLLPSSYNQKRTVMLNYEVLAKMYVERKDHKLNEWHVFCDWIKTLPYPELIIGEVERNDG